MGAKKFKDYAEAEEALKAAKEERDVAKGEFTGFKKEKGIKGEEPEIKDEKVAKQFNKLKATLEKKRGEVDEIKKWMDENKPRKERAQRDTKYEYPEGATADDKKKIRAKARAEAKKAAKEASGDKPKKKDKKEEKPEKEGKEAKKDKGSSKKEKKEKAEQED